MLFKTTLKEFIRQSAKREIHVGSYGRFTVTLDSQGTMAFITESESLPRNLENMGAIRSQKNVDEAAKMIVTDIADHNGELVNNWMELHKGDDSRILLIGGSGGQPKISLLDPAKWEIFRRADRVYTEGGNKPVLFRFYDGSWGYVLPIRMTESGDFHRILQNAASAWEV